MLKLSKNQKILLFLVLFIIVIITVLIISYIQNHLVDFKLMKLLEREKKFTTEFIKNKFIELNIGNKNVESNNYRIPFIIYRTWKNTNLNEQFMHAWNTTSINNPEFEQKLYTDLDVNSFINDFDYPGLKKAYNRINPKYGAARADLFRYAILYKNGGFYMDIKTYTECSIKDKLGNNDAFLLSKWKSIIFMGNRKFFEKHSLSFSERVGEWEQYWLACEKEHPIMKAILDKCIDNILNPKGNNLLPDKNKSANIAPSYEVFVTTGPLMMTYVVDNYIINNSNSNDFTITRPSFYNCIKYTKGGMLDHRSAYVKNSEKHYSQVTEPLLIY